MLIVKKSFVIAQDDGTIVYRPKRSEYTDNKKIRVFVKEKFLNFSNISLRIAI